MCKSKTEIKTLKLKLKIKQVELEIEKVILKKKRVGFYKGVIVLIRELAAIILMT